MEGTRRCMDTLSNILEDMGTHFDDDLGNTFEDELVTDLDSDTGFSLDEFGYDEIDDDRFWEQI